ncbi:nuclear transport factor 2 family protein [Novosphingobium sp. 9]|uniref:nuclear transport factor 2 family protein n=1 Tax=Novosphingobium sp. 9 TaxID=2025349 RepID=UPI0021B59CF5|nr:ester cyclase [Novosphingobium sp. 9]
MTRNIQTIEKLYAAAEGNSLDIPGFLACFASDGYARNVPAGIDFHGEDIALVASGMVEAFPDVHREIFHIAATDDLVVVELAIRGEHQGTLVTPAGPMLATGKRIDVPCCDVFHMKDGKVTAFHCYNAANILQQQLI